MTVLRIPCCTATDNCYLHGSEQVGAGRGWACIVSVWTRFFMKNCFRWRRRACSFATIANTLPTNNFSVKTVAFCDFGCKLPIFRSFLFSCAVARRCYRFALPAALQLALQNTAYHRFLARPYRSLGKQQKICRRSARGVVVGPKHRAGRVEGFAGTGAQHWRTLGFVDADAHRPGSNCEYASSWFDSR